jgi:hypothetical protein
VVAFAATKTSDFRYIGKHKAFIYTDESDKPFDIWLKNRPQFTTSITQTLMFFVISGGD